MLEFKLKPSLWLFRLNLGLYALSAILLLAYYPPGLISTSLLGLILLLFSREYVDYRQNHRKYRETLCFNLSSSAIKYQFNDDILQFRDYSVYTCRWGIILVLKKSKCRKKIILLVDRFENLHSYLDLRFHLTRLNQAVHVS